MVGQPEKRIVTLWDAVSLPTVRMKWNNEMDGHKASMSLTQLQFLLRMIKIMKKETDGHTAHKKSLTLTTLRTTNIMEE